VAALFDTVHKASGHTPYAEQMVFVLLLDEISKAGASQNVTTCQAGVSTREKNGSGRRCARWLAHDM